MIFLNVFFRCRNPSCIVGAFSNRPRSPEQQFVCRIGRYVYLFRANIEPATRSATAASNLHLPAGIDYQQTQHSEIHAFSSN